MEMEDRWFCCTQNENFNIEKGRKAKERVWKGHVKMRISTLKWKEREKKGWKGHVKNLR